ncbi:MAG: hypothetical protein HY717_17205 [Planctomycetes bacterium]|nr:hypothetical protein [Planctomycetota bacterium]
MEDLRQRAQALERSEEALRRSNKELEQFAYVASHDLQEPLRKILSFGERLKSHCASVLDASGRDSLERMQSAAARMRHLIEDLLQYSRVTINAQPFQPVSLESVIQEVLADLEARILESRGQIEVGTLPTVAADRMQMGQLFQNLISNALKFKKREAPPHVVIKSQAPNRELVEIGIQDNGIGFDEKYLERIFQPFQRLHTHGEIEGTGMGLAICQKIVERHGGRITAKSSPGKGATFIVLFPVLK